MAENLTCRRKKWLLLHYVKKRNAKNPDHLIHRPDGFDVTKDVIGPPAREFVRNMQRMTGLKETGRFDQPTMVKLLPLGVRGHVMARAHAEVGEHEWPPGSNMGEIVKYLASVGLGGGYPWCAAFVTWVLKKEGFAAYPPGPASADSWGTWAKQKGITKPKAQSRMGDLWVWEWNASTDGMYDHIGFCDEGIHGANAFFIDGNVGAYGGTVTDASRYAGNIAVTIDIVKLHALK
jgi:hypothetical protein